MGSFQRLEHRRLLAIGDFDPTFGNGGFVATAFNSNINFANAVTVDHNGKIVAVGAVTLDNNLTETEMAIARYNPDGTLDTTFGLAGKVVVPPLASGLNDNQATCVAIDSSNRIVVGGFVQVGSVPPRDYFVAFRLKADGTPDPTFGGDDGAPPGSEGVGLNTKGGDYRAAGIAVDDFGNIVLVGSARRSKEDASVYDFGVARLTSTGHPDPTFGNSGTLVIPMGALDNKATCVAIDHADRIVVGGSLQMDSSGTHDFVVARITTDGVLDNTFNGDGKSLIAFDRGGSNDDQAYAVAVGSQDQIVLAGSSAGPGGEKEFAVVRLTDTAAFDTSFNGTGKETLAFDLGSSVGDATGRSVLIDRSNRIIVSGDAQAGSDAGYFASARLNDNGSLESQFGKRIATFRTNTLFNGATSAALDQNGQLILAGIGAQSNVIDFGLVRFVANLPPVAVDDTYVLSQAPSSFADASLGALINDYDPGGDHLYGDSVTNPAHGTLVANGDGSFLYTPNATFQGIDRVTYTIDDGYMASNTATSTVLSYHASLVDKVYHQVLHRPAEDQGLLYWTAQLDAGKPLEIVATGIFNSTERLNPLVAQFYQQFLGRGNDPGGLNFWVTDWKSKGDPRDVVENILASQEFFDDAGDTSKGFISLLYQRVLNRPAESGGLNFWLTQEGDPPTPQQRLEIASQFYDTHEKHVNLVDFLFGEYFQGVSPSPDATPFITDLDQGQTETQVEKAIIDSSAYSSYPPEPAAGSVGRAMYPH